MVRIDLAQARAALGVAAQQTAGLLRAAGDGGQPARGCAWTVGQVAAHLAIVPEGFADAARGTFDRVARYLPDSDLYPERLATVTWGTLDLVAERDPAALAAAVVEAVGSFLAATEDRSGDDRLPTPWYGRDASLSVAAATCILLGEQVVHGYDVARTVNRPWPIDPDVARLIIAGATSMMPLAVNHATAADVTADVEMRVRGGPRFVMRFVDGRLRIEDPGTQRVDCRIGADPVALVLVMYGRQAQWGPIARGQLTTWGRKPWLALRLTSYFHNP